MSVKCGKLLFHADKSLISLNLFRLWGVAITLAGVNSVWGWGSRLRNCLDWILEPEQELRPELQLGANATFVMVGGGKLKVTNTSLPFSLQVSYQGGKNLAPCSEVFFRLLTRSRTFLIEPSHIAYWNMSCWKSNFSTTAHITAAMCIWHHVVQASRIHFFIVLPGQKIAILLSNFQSTAGWTCVDWGSDLMLAVELVLCRTQKRVPVDVEAQSHSDRSPVLEASEGEARACSGFGACLH